MGIKAHNNFLNQIDAHFQKYNGRFMASDYKHSVLSILPLLGITGLNKRNSSLYYLALPHWMFNLYWRIITFLKLKKNNYIYFSHLIHNLLFVLFSNLQKD